MSISQDCTNGSFVILHVGQVHKHLVELSSYSKRSNSTGGFLLLPIYINKEIVNKYAFNKIAIRAKHLMAVGNKVYGLSEVHQVFIYA